jgi:hypothetical protein
MSRSHFGIAVCVLGLLVLLLAIAWWWVVYSQVISNDYMSYPQAMPCLISSSDRCALAQVLCRGSHFLGIRGYSATLLWAGLCLTCVGLFVADSKSRA